MKNSVSENTKAVLLLTSPLIVGKGKNYADLLSISEYNRLARFLHEDKKQPLDLLKPDADDLLKSCAKVCDVDKLRRLLSRGFLLSQVLTDWQNRSIWVVSRADDSYPKKIKKKLKEDAPPILYGCGNISLVESEGLGVVGSRDVDDSLVDYTKAVAKLAVKAGKVIYSGGARGIDQAAMVGAIENLGAAVGIVADSLEKSATSRLYREALMNDRMLLLSPYDPKAGFNVGNAMNRNKLIYALSSATLVVNSDFNKGGTWNGAVEQLTKLHYSKVYVRSTGQPSKGLEALTRKGAFVWPNPADIESFASAIKGDYSQLSEKPLEKLFVKEVEISSKVDDVTSTPPPSNILPKNNLNPGEELFLKVKELIFTQLSAPKSIEEVAKILCVSNPQAKAWIDRLIKEQTVLKQPKTKRYMLKTQLALSSTL
ncbi:DNA-processing protein DprA [Dyadobacter sandarakinus]|uniref:DNA-protecting protein DprA n=1 Tax=Dyadobacter sandarakinus TaxID=2747268 RepID=A0ABX7I7C5_9BACT|nr:DNA-processing protein DprA [Dyadobacter sandarakinus]QRR01447.1 DNA-protecting protein DprA [Dyadobacter sandarakinus]